MTGIDINGLMWLLGVGVPAIILLYYKGDEWGMSLREAFLIILTITVVRFFFFAVYVIPSGSMKPTLLIGDYILVNRFEYGYGQYSFPFGLAPIKDRVFGKIPTRGDQVVFRPSPDIHTPYIKRVVGLPGDKVQMIDGYLHINGFKCPLEFVEEIETKSQPDRYGVMHKIKAKVFIETLPNGVKHKIQKVYPFGTYRYDNTGVFTVPRGNLFMVGDNRDESGDSRVIEQVGFVPIRNIIGKALYILFSFDKTEPMWKWPFTIRFSRFLKSVDSI